MKIDYRRLALEAVAEGVDADLTFELDRFASRYEREIEGFDRKLFYMMVNGICYGIKCELYKRLGVEMI